MNKRKITAWWDIPCKSAIPYFEELNKEADMEVKFIAVRPLSEQRRKLGWQTAFSGSMESHTLSDHDWKQRVDEELADRSQFHVVNGIYHYVRTKYLTDQLVQKGLEFGLIMEAPSNLEVGLRRVVKSLLGPMVTRMRAKNAAQNARFVLSASGNRQQAFKRLGFDAEKIFPFGYFPDFPLIERDAKPANSLSILCIGFLKPYKGHDYLLHAIAKLKERGVPVQCIITGFGSTADRLKALQKQLNLEDDVEYPGVVDNQKLIELFKWSNVLVAPGLEEPWGIRINEALLSGLPVVVSDRIGAKELVEASGAGEIFHSGSVQSLTDALTRYYSRISVENDVFEMTKRYRKMIEPRSAGHYLAEVIRYFGGDENSAAHNNARPMPPWLEWRQLH